MGLFDFLKKKSVEEKKPTPEVAPEEVEKQDAPEETAEPASVATPEAESVPESKEDETETETASEASTDEVVPETSKTDEAAELVAPTTESSDASEEEPAQEPEVEVEPEPEVKEVPESEPEATQPAAAPVESSVSEEQRYEKGLEKSRSSFGSRLNKLLANFRHVDEDFFEELEEALIESDVGFETSMKISEALREEVKLQNAKKTQDVQNVVIEKLVDIYESAGEGENNQINFAETGPTVIMFVGVNGVGKTTTIGKMAAMYKQQGKKVLLAAADTFRAGAIQQLNEWAIRDGVDIVKGKEGGDPAAVVFDGVKKAKEEAYDILFVDTAGRLQNKVNLMNELTKMKRVITREIPAAPHEVLLVLDSTTGQNALNQAKLFQESTDVSGIVLTKLDGTARGGIVLPIRNELHLPVKFVGLGETVNDLRPFKPEDFVYGLFKGLIK
ncbi:signal recognition particle protein [Secundilactobacillus oryzae JCM 18671]|uniref:Signal recognition particle receptor FtsY n=1 Tax=Secundilactobacillus oryzae JCM 18671 TaxID=1291743 RepID=A0A081BFU0_9LACO|nr:signal recognition particle-docking protein FtsY [Secundilactobacillus oryzae]GAK46908.1 signal recognition particle protein [Secundilactobacillus oryzae JCM 18671]